MALEGHSGSAQKALQGSETEGSCKEEQRRKSSVFLTRGHCFANKILMLVTPLINGHTSEIGAVEYGPQTDK